ncbi:J domain-containing protein [Actinoplanes sp. NBC_00393]|uniref:J domain-containing protein n=1 Tax=Actinoplanes sp. NBC_00393 TaxID=2975953 RepID=UPI002E22421B
MFRVELDTDSLYAVLGISPDATQEQINRARDTGVHELRLRQRNEPVNRDELIRLQKILNAAGEELARPARRREYDAANPHLRLFSVRTAAAPMFRDPVDQIVALRRAITRHLDEAGAPPPAASDLERRDFTADMTWHPLLDDDERPGRYRTDGTPHG